MKLREVFFLFRLLARSQLESKRSKTGRLEKGFLALLHSAKVVIFPKIPSCYCTLLMQPSAFTFIATKTF